MKESLCMGLTWEGYLQDMVTTKAQDEVEQLQNLVKKLWICIIKAEQQVEILQQLVLLQQQITRDHKQAVVYQQQVVDTFKQAAVFQQ